jgi:hypothetical protein
MNTSELSVEQIEIVTEGRALAEEHSVAVLAVALANKVSACGNVGDVDAARVVALCTALFVQQTTPVQGAVARRPKH